MSTANSRARETRARFVRYLTGRCQRRPIMSDVQDHLREIRRRARARGARRKVSQKLTLYHKSLVQSLEPQTYSFFERVMEEARRRSQRPNLIPQH